MTNDKFILDACCGPRMFWFNKHHPNALYIDNRKEEKGFIDNRKNTEIQPDFLMDFRKLEFPDKSFKLVVWDPPHIIQKETGGNFILGKVFGLLNPETWKEDLKQGFNECWRVLEDFGVLVFKWSDSSASLKEILEVIEKEPLFGQKTRSSTRHFKMGLKGTYWICFMKIPEKKSGEKLI